MSDTGVTFGTEAAGGFPAGLLQAGPGRLAPEDLPNVLIFDAGRLCLRGDPLTRFYNEDLAALDWLRDYLMDEDYIPVGENFGASFKVEEDVEDAYNKAALTSIEADSGWADA